MKRDYSLSIVTPTYNRAHLICRSLDASLQLVAAGIASEIVVVDDASSDGTLQMLQLRYQAEIASGVLVVDVFAVNQGVTAAKNRGAVLAKGLWIAFMDSDDNFIVEHANLMNALLQQHQTDDAVFFRCRDNQSKQLIGPETTADYISLSQLINGGTPGECLPVVKRSSILQYVYPAELRGSESLSYFAILAKGGRIFISDLVLREYDHSGDDRLSAKAGLRARADKLVRHNMRTLKYIGALQLKTLFGVFARIVYYSWLSFLNKVTK
jgi:glycosyltransferase involved in cell wall biosynthesis